MADRHELTEHDVARIMDRMMRAREGRGAGAYVNGSDERIKENIQPLGESTAIIESIEPVTFSYKKSWARGQRVQPGFIAQQLQEALAGTPYLEGVVHDDAEYLSVAYQTLIPLLIKALQESNARIAALESRHAGPAE